MHNPQQAAPNGPDILHQLNFGGAAARVVTTALQLNIFSTLAQGAAAADEVATKVKASQRGTRMILDALTGFELLAKHNGKYELSPLAAQYLVKESPDYCAAMMESGNMQKSWDALTDVVRTGRPVVRVEAQEGAENFFPTLVKSLHVMNRAPAQVAAKALVGGSKNALEVLDVAAGSGVWGIACAEANPNAQVTALDFPGVLELTKTYVRNHRVSDRFDYLAGDLKQVDLGSQRYDVAILGNIVHTEGEASSRDLFKRISRALKPGGKIAIVDMIANNERTAPPFALIFALMMFLHTEQGDTFTMKDYSEWLKEAGFTPPEAVDIHSHSPLIVATRA